MKRLCDYGKVVIAGAIFCWALITGFIVMTECRFPGSDVFLFKEAAINFALKSRLVASNLVYMPQDVELPFAHYPPIYPTVFGLWMKVFGIGIQQSLFFECLLRGLRTLLLGALIWPQLKSALADRKLRTWAAVVVGFLCALSLISTDDDRPDELGLIFGLSCWWLLTKAQTTYQSFVVGLFLGITAATSPAAGVCIGLGVLAYLFSHRNWKKGLLGISVGAVLSLSICLTPMLIFHGEVFKRFSHSAGASSFPYPMPWHPQVSWELFWNRIQYCMNHYVGVGFRLIFCLFCSLTLMFLLRQKGKLFQSPFQMACLIFAGVAPFVWALQPYYLWFSILPVTIFFLGEQLNAKSTQRVFGILGIAVAFTPMFFQEMKNFVSVIYRPPQEKASYVREKLLEQIKPEERVAVSFDQFFTLRNQREISDVNFVCIGLDRFDYVYVTRIFNAKQGHPSAVPIPCWWSQKTKCFDPIQDFSTNHPLIIAGWNTGYVTRGNGGTLYKNTRCHENITHIPSSLSEKGVTPNLINRVSSLF